MTDEEFQRIKEAEKDRLRAKKRLHETLDALKRRQEVQSVVQQMSQGAKYLLRETESLAETLAQQAGRQAARLELALDNESVDDASLEEADEALREERAEEIIRRFKAEDRSEARPGDSTEEASDDGDDSRPEKTIGRMDDTRSSDEST